mmetsp:Transcript_9984/g.11608  ORF Transcript_9984/g.11608 Transcript_9984/m.11608 type:complete len:220 (+) Transcript_9984:564-1223(+)
MLRLRRVVLFFRPTAIAVAPSLLMRFPSRSNLINALFWLSASPKAAAPISPTWHSTRESSTRQVLRARPLARLQVSSSGFIWYIALLRNSTVRRSGLFSVTSSTATLGMRPPNLGITKLDPRFLPADGFGASATGLSATFSTTFAGDSLGSSFFSGAASSSFSGCASSVLPSSSAGTSSGFSSAGTSSSGCSFSSEFSSGCSCSSRSSSLESSCSSGST